MLNIPRKPGPDAVDAMRWLRGEQARLRPALMLHAFRPPAHAAHRRAADRLRDIAGDLETRIADGSFGLCFAHDRQDMATLPGALRAIADEIGGKP